ncbi:Transcription factor [Aspergillus sclerotialis]|uniref:Transcription factor n=1 Tax=Aspergillus sclerotialis TaxID=2070753 RepID=A0A3A2ZWG9_9EURO|nr:Transcription factor [Aspergillus sclerotialis]
MSTAQPTAENQTSGIFPGDAAVSRVQPQKPQRVLACALCQQRKVKCDRKYPCSNCIKSRVECIPTQASRRRRRRFPERELLERLRKYEDLLRQNNIQFEPLHDSTGEKVPLNVESQSSNKERNKGLGWPSPLSTANSEGVYDPEWFWHSMNERIRDQQDDSDSSDDGNVREVVFKDAWAQLFKNNDHLLLGPTQTAVDLSTVHPEPVQIIRLWQLYLENVDPLLKVTHTPSLQGRIIEAASNVLNIDPILEALMFSLYCMAILSLTMDDCQSIFGSSKDDLLARYQFGCQQALLRCGFLRTSDRDCLTALYLYLVSVGPSTVPHSLSSMLGVAIRIALRMGVHNERSLAICTPLEAEMRRRLWWSLVLFDTRVGELANSKTTMLTPEWDCGVPLNVNDSDLRLEMKEPPQVLGVSTEALFTVLRSELGEFTRHTVFHLGFTCPSLKPLARHGADIEGIGLDNLEKTIESKYLEFCDEENPLHFMTIWTTRGHIAKCRFIEHCFKYPNPSTYQTEAQRDAVFSYAITMLECDTRLMTAPLTKGFRWLTRFYFPFPAYIRITQLIQRRPISEQADQAWEAMSNNFEARFYMPPVNKDPFFSIFSNIILQAWASCETAFKQTEETLVTPRIVQYIRQHFAQRAPTIQRPDVPQPDNGTTMVAGDFPMPTPNVLDQTTLSNNMEGQGCVPGMGWAEYPGIPGFILPEVDTNQIDWFAMNWDLANVSPDQLTGLPQFQ